MTIDSSAERALMNATRDIARDVILPRYRALAPGDIDTKTHAEDLVTVADRESEARLTEAVHRILPGAAVVGEEAVSEDASITGVIADADLAVIIDPIDGTWNFANGVNTFGVILAATSHGKTVWGGIYDPLADDWMVAHAGGGARFVARDGATWSLSVGEAPTAFGDVSGLIPLYLYYPEEKVRLAAMYPEFRRINTLRCSAHEYRQMAEGRCDFLLTAHLNPWDHAAGALLLTEAGGVARMVDGRNYAPTLTTGRMLSARSEALWSMLEERVGFLGETE